jgi:hypothetical protein
LFVAAGVLLAVCLLRLPVFFRSVMDRDESLYFLIAEQWRAGRLPYTTIWDNKPLGIYAIFLLFQTVFGDHIRVIRFAAAVFTSVTSLAIFQMTRLITGTAVSATFAGLAYIIGSLSNDGLASNTEIFMTCFTSLAMLGAVDERFCRGQPLARGFFCGLLFSLAFMTKYVAIFEAPALAFALFLLHPAPAKLRFIPSCMGDAPLAVARHAGAGRHPRLSNDFSVVPDASKSMLSSVTLGAMLGAATPLALVILLYAGAGDLPAWWDESILSNLRRVAVPVPPGALRYAFTLQISRWLPLYAAGAILVLVTAWQWRDILQPPRRFQVFLVLWLAGGALGVYAAKSFYDHYFLQILPVLSISLAWLVWRIGGTFKWQPALMAVLLAMPANAAVQALVEATQPILKMQNGKASLQPDPAARIAAEINNTPAGMPRQVYVFDDQPVIYSLTGEMPPTRYAFPSILSTCALSHVAGVQGTAEVKRILSAKPEYIVRSRYLANDPNQAVYAMLAQFLATRYVLWRSYGNSMLYRLRDGAGSADITIPAETCNGP